MGCISSTLNSDPTHRDDLQPQPHPLYSENEVKRTAVFSTFLSNQLASRENGTAREHDQRNLSYQPNASGNFSYGSVVGDTGAREPRTSEANASTNGKAKDKWKASVHMSDGKTYSLTQGRIGDEVQMNGRGRKKSQPYDDGQDQNHDQDHKQHQSQKSKCTNILPGPNNEASGSGSGSGSGSKTTTSRLPQPQAQAQPHTQPHTQPPKKSKQQLKAEARVRWSRTRDHSFQGAAFGFG